MSKAPKIICPFSVLLIKRCNSDGEYWEFDEKTAVIQHDMVSCPCKHFSPFWMVDQHPIWLAEMMKEKKARRNRPKIVAALASGENGSWKLCVTTRQLENAERHYKKDQHRGLLAGLQRVPKYLEQLVEMNPTAYASLEYDETAPTGVTDPPGSK